MRAGGKSRAFHRSEATPAARLPAAVSVHAIAVCGPLQAEDQAERAYAGTVGVSRAEDEPGVPGSRFRSEYVTRGRGGPEVSFYLLTGLSGERSFLRRGPRRRSGPR
jgi:hypothetical protein